MIFQLTCGTVQHYYSYRKLVQVLLVYQVFVEKGLIRIVQNNQCRNNPRHPSTESKQQHDKKRTAALPQNGQRRKKYGEQYAYKTHFVVIFLIDDVLIGRNKLSIVTKIAKKFFVSF